MFMRVSGTCIIKTDEKETKGILKLVSREQTDNAIGEKNKIQQLE